ncbi:hypothetical protein GCM10027185_31720 [Spirosoma pulveris]
MQGLIGMMAERSQIFPETPIQGIAEDREGGLWLNSKRYDRKSFPDLSDWLK